jgi:hypothetical protein
MLRDSYLLEGSSPWAHLCAMACTPPFLVLCAYLHLCLDADEDFLTYACPCLSPCTFSPWTCFCFYLSGSCPYSCCVTCFSFLSLAGTTYKGLWSLAINACKFVPGFASHITCTL